MRTKARGEARLAAELFGALVGADVALELLVLDSVLVELVLLPVEVVDLEFEAVLEALVVEDAVVLLELVDEPEVVEVTEDTVGDAVEDPVDEDTAVVDPDVDADAELDAAEPPVMANSWL